MCKKNIQDCEEGLGWQEKKMEFFLIHEGIAYEAWRKKMRWKVLKGIVTSKVRKKN